MDSIVAIAQEIAGLNCEPEIKECLQALMNHELVSNANTPVSKLTYIREIDAKFDSWQSMDPEVID